MCLCLESGRCFSCSASVPAIPFLFSVLEFLFPCQDQALIVFKTQVKTSIQTIFSNASRRESISLFGSVEEDWDVINPHPGSLGWRHGYFKSAESPNPIVPGEAGKEPGQSMSQVLSMGAKTGDPGFVICWLTTILCDQHPHAVNLLFFFSLDHQCQVSILVSFLWLLISPSCLLFTHKGY